MLPRLCIVWLILAFKFIGMKKLITIIVGLGLVATSLALAQQAPLDQGDFSYYLHLYYDNGRLVFNRDAQLKYEVALDTYKPEQAAEATSYVGELVSVSGVKIAKFSFDPTKGDASFKKGVVDVKAPYYDNAKLINIYNNQRLLLLSVDVSGTLACNENKICEENLGENFDNCPNDCKAGPSPSLSTTPEVSVAPSIFPTPSGGSNGWLGKLLVILAIAAVAGLGIWIIIRSRRL